MNSALIPLDNYIQGLGFSHQTYTDLSKNSSGVPLVSFTLKEAYCFDDIIKDLFNNSSLPHSVDALLLKNNLYFIEFKSVAGVSTGEQQKCIKQNLSLKLSESELVFYKKMAAPLALDLSKFKRIAIIVVDYVSSPITAISATLVGLSGSYSMTLTNNNFPYHRLPDKSGEFVFYDDVRIWNNINFAIQIVHNLSYLYL